MTFSILSLATLAGVTSGESQAEGNCPYGGDYIKCLEAGQSVDYCKQYVLNCEDTSGPMTEDPEPCDWLVDTQLGDDCPFSSSYLRVGFPIDVTNNNVTCPYDSYVECLLAGRGVTWCKQYQLNCRPGEITTVVVPIEAACGPFAIDGTIVYRGWPEIVGSNYCLHVTSYDYTGGQSSTVDAEIEAELAKPNPDCGGDTYCVCMPASCL